MIYLHHRFIRITCITSITRFTTPPAPQHHPSHRAKGGGKPSSGTSRATPPNVYAFCKMRHPAEQPGRSADSQKTLKRISHKRIATSKSVEVDNTLAPKQIKQTTQQKINISELRQQLGYA